MVSHFYSDSGYVSTQKELQAPESLVIRSYTKRIRKNGEKRYQLIGKMADNNTNSFDFLCQAGESKVLQAYQESMEHLSGRSVYILYPTAIRATDSALTPFSVPRWGKTLSKSSRRRRI